MRPTPGHVAGEGRVVVVVGWTNAPMITTGPWPLHHRVPVEQVQDGQSRFDLLDHVTRQANTLQGCPVGLTERGNRKFGGASGLVYHRDICDYGFSNDFFRLAGYSAKILETDNGQII